MVLKIEKDHQRFRQIVKGKIRGDLRKFLTRGELIGKEGKHLISIPVHGIAIPTFRCVDNPTVRAGVTCSGGGCWNEEAGREMGGPPGARQAHVAEYGWQNLRARN